MGIVIWAQRDTCVSPLCIVLPHNWDILIRWLGICGVLALISCVWRSPTRLHASFELVCVLPFCWLRSKCSVLNRNIPGRRRACAHLDGAFLGYNSLGVLWHKTSFVNGVFGVEMRTRRRRRRNLLQKSDALPAAPDNYCKIAAHLRRVWEHLSG